VIGPGELYWKVMSEPNDPLVMEDVERRSDLRGPIEALEITFPDNQTFSVVEASRKDLFAITNDPEAFRLGDVQEVTLRQNDKTFSCRVEVVRKSIHPRKGVALRLVHIAPVAEETLKQILAAR